MKDYHAPEGLAAQCYASASPSPVIVLTPKDGDAGTTSRPLARSFSTSFLPINSAAADDDEFHGGPSIAIESATTAQRKEGVSSRGENHPLRMKRPLPRKGQERATGFEPATSSLGS